MYQYNFVQRANHNPYKSRTSPPPTHWNDQLKQSRLNRSILPPPNCALSVIDMRLNPLTDTLAPVSPLRPTNIPIPAVPCCLTAAPHAPY